MWWCHPSMFLQASRSAAAAPSCRILVPIPLSSGSDIGHSTDLALLQGARVGPASIFQVLFASCRDVTLLYLSLSSKLQYPLQCLLLYSVSAVVLALVLGECRAFGSLRAGSWSVALTEGQAVGDLLRWSWQLRDPEKTWKQRVSQRICWSAVWGRQVPCGPTEVTDQPEDPLLPCLQIVLGGVQVRLSPGARLVPCRWRPQAKKRL